MQELGRMIKEDPNLCAIPRGGGIPLCSGL